MTYGDTPRRNAPDEQIRAAAPASVVARRGEQTLLPVCCRHPLFCARHADFAQRCYTEILVIRHFQALFHFRYFALRHATPDIFHAFPYTEFLHFFTKAEPLMIFFIFAAMPFSRLQPIFHWLQPFSHWH
jgi:hypothetical protein